VANLFELGFGKRPAEELYDLRTDAAELRNLASDKAHAQIKSKLAAELEQQLKTWRDPRATGAGDELDRPPSPGSRSETDFFDKPAGKK